MNKYVLAFITFAFGVSLVVFLSSCGKPKVSELLEGGIDCDVAITMPPDGVRPTPGEQVLVKARFSNCREVAPKTR